MTSFYHIKAVFFDLDNTLVNHNAAEEAALEDVLQHFTQALRSYSAPVSLPVFLQAYRPVNEIIWHEMAAHKITPDELKTERFVRTIAVLCPLLSQTKYYELCVKMGVYYLQQYRLYWSAVQGAEEILSRFASHSYIGVISNGFSEQQWGKLSFLGWENKFHSVILSGEVGVMKPQKKIFDLALATLPEPVLPSEVLYIGDNYRSDIEGAWNAGWASIWINESGLEPEGNKAHWTVPSLQSILHIP